VKQIMAAFPPMERLCTGDPGQIKAILDQAHPYAFPLFQWIIQSNLCHIVKLSPEQSLECMKTRHQYLLLSASPDKEARFHELKSQHGTRQLARSRVCACLPFEVEAVTDSSRILVCGRFVLCVPRLIDRELARDHSYGPAQRLGHQVAGERCCIRQGHLPLGIGAYACIFMQCSAALMRLLTPTRRVNRVKCLSDTAGQRTRVARNRVWMNDSYQTQSHASAWRCVKVRLPLSLHRPTAAMQWLMHVGTAQ